MAAYMLVQTLVNDENAFARYVEAVGPVIDRHGGVLVAKGSSPLVLEGNLAWSTAGVLRFDSLEAAMAFWNSPDYAEVKLLRSGAAKFFAMVIQGPDCPLERDDV